jgi:excisionase family DNA binding protein
MKVKNMPDEIVAMAAMGLATYCPGLTPEKLLAALKAFEPNKPSAAEQFLTPTEVQSAFRISRRTLARWTKAGKIRAVRPLGSRRFLFPAADVIGAMELEQGENDNAATA